MKNAIIIENMTRDELEAILSSSTTHPVEDVACELTVDRGFIMRNLGCSRRTIMTYEHRKVLNRIVNPEDMKSIYYKLSDYLEMHKSVRNKADRL